MCLVVWVRTCAAATVYLADGVQTLRDRRSRPPNEQPRLKYA